MKTTTMEHQLGETQMEIIERDATAIQEHIQVGQDSRETSQQMSATNPDNMFVGTFKLPVETEPGETTQADVRDLFVQEATLNGEPVQTITSDGKKVLQIEVPVPTGVVKSITLRGASQEGQPTLPDEDGNVDLVLDGVECASLDVGQLTLDGDDVKGLFVQGATYNGSPVETTTSQDGSKILEIDDPIKDICVNGEDVEPDEDGKVNVQTSATFDTYADLTEYAQGSNAYPGMFATVTSGVKSGPYVLMSDGQSLTPIPLGVVRADAAELTKLQPEYEIDQIATLLNQVVDVLQGMRM